MEKREFLEKLRGALSGRATADVITENLDYYEDYINTEVRKGRSEEEVLDLLGDPRLIARTILETNGGKAGREQDEVSGSRSGGKTDVIRELLLRIPGRVWTVLVILAVILVLSVIFRVIAAIAPFLIVMAIVLFLVRAFRDWID